MTRTPRRLLTFWLVFAFTVTTALGFSSVAHAHADLDFSTPDDGAVLESAPEEVVLTFTEELFNELVEVSILDSAGELVMVTEVEQTPPPGTDVIVSWPGDLPAGEYSVAYRVVSEDGHPVTGQISFSYAAASQPTPEPTIESTPEPTIESTPEPTPEPTPELFDDESSSSSPSAAAAGEPNSSLIGPLLIGAAIVVGIGVIFSIVMLARSRQ